MRFFFHSQADAMFAINRCYFEADHARASLAVDRLRDLADEIPDNCHVAYAEGFIRRDYLGQGFAAYSAFAKAYADAAGDESKRDTARLAAFNAAMLAPDEKEFRRWAKVALQGDGEDKPQDRRILIDLLAELDRGVTYLPLLLHRLGPSHEPGDDPGSTAAVLELALEDPLMAEDATLELEYRNGRAMSLRALDKKTQELRQNMGEAFLPDERITLQEALRELERCLELNPDDATLWNFKSAWLGLLERHEEGITAADRAIELRPYRYARPHFNRAYCLYQLGRWKEAVASIKEAKRHAEEENSAQEIEQARILLQTYSQPPTVPTLKDLQPALVQLAQGAGLLSQEELAQVRRSDITIDMVVDRLVRHVRSVPVQPSKGYVALVAQLLGDFTPESAMAAAYRASRHERRVGDYLFWATLYLAAHSEAVQRRDAARLCALMILAFAENPQVLRQFYRWHVLETSAAATDEMAKLDTILRDALGRINRWLPPLIADQEPVDATGIARGRRILSQFSGPLPQPIDLPVPQEPRQNLWERLRNSFGWQREGFTLPQGCVPAREVPSPNALRLAYVVQGSNGVHPEINRQRFPGGAQVHGMTFSRDSSTISYALNRGRKLAPQWYVVFNGQEYGPYDDIGVTSPVISPDSSSVAYSALLNREWSVLRDGKIIGGPYEALCPGGVIFSPDSRQVAYGTKCGQTWKIVNDKQEYGPYPAIVERSWVFSPDSKKLAFIAFPGGSRSVGRWTDRACVVVNGQQGTTWPWDKANKQSLMHEIYFSPDSNRLAYGVFTGDEFFYVIDGQSQRAYSGLITGLEGDPAWSRQPDHGRASCRSNNLTFSPDSRHFAYGVVDHHRKCGIFVYDGEERGAHQGILNRPVVFSPDSSRVAYGAAENNRQFLVVDGIPLRKYYGLAGGATSFSPNSKHVAYVAMTSLTAFVLAVDAEGVPIRDIPVARASLVWDNSDSMHTLAMRIADGRVVICRWPGDG